MGKQSQTNKVLGKLQECENINSLGEDNIHTYMNVLFFKFLLISIVICDKELQHMNM